MVEIWMCALEKEATVETLIYLQRYCLLETMSNQLHLTGSKHFAQMIRYGHTSSHACCVSVRMRIKVSYGIEG